MKNKIPFSIIFFLTRSLFLGMVYSKIINITNEDSIIACIIGTFLGCFIIFLFHKLDLQNKYSKIIYFFICNIFLFLSLMTLEYFINSFFLVNTPKIVIAIPFILLSLYLISKKQQVIFNSSKILFYISIFFIIIAFISLCSYFDFSNILPLFNNKYENFFYASFIYMIASAMPNILINTKQLNTFTHIKYYLISSLINMLICISIILVLTANIAKIYSFPEYMVLKRIKIFNFIENIENIISMIFYFDLFYLATLAIKNLKLSINNNIIFNIYIITFTMIVTFKIINYYYFLLYVYNYIYIVLFILFLLLLFKRKKS